MKILYLSIISVLTLTTYAYTPHKNDEKIPVIIETDIGQFMDDAWALTFLLKDPLVDIRLIVASTNNTELRAKIIAKFCDISNNGNIPIAISDKTSDYAGPQSYWASGYNLTAYPGQIIRGNSAQVVASFLKKSLLAGERVHLVELSPPIVFSQVAQTYPELLKQTVSQTDFMGGCFKYGYGHSFGQTTEYNAKFDINATDKFFNAIFDSPLQLSPLDTSAQVRISGDDYQRVLLASKNDVLLGALIESFRVWWKMCPEDPLGIMCPVNDPDSFTSSLFDLQAAAFASSYGEELKKFVVMEKNLMVAINETGFTNIDVGKGSLMDVFMEWENLSGFITELTNIIIN